MNLWLCWPSGFQSTPAFFSAKYYKLAYFPIHFSFGGSSTIEICLSGIPGNGKPELCKFSRRSSQAGYNKTYLTGVLYFTRLSSRPTLGWQSKLCLRVTWMYCWLYKRHEMDTERMNAALSPESSIRWVGTMLLTPEILHHWVVWVPSCRFISEISHRRILSVLVLFVFHRVFALLFRTSPKRTLNALWLCL